MATKKPTDSLPPALAEWLAARVESDAAALVEQKRIAAALDEVRAALAALGAAPAPVAGRTTRSATGPTVEEVRAKLRARREGAV